MLSRTYAGALVAVALGGATVFAQQQQQAQESQVATVVGCVERAEHDVHSGQKSPTGFVLMNASTSAFGGTLDGDSAAVATTGTDRPKPARDQARSDEPRRDPDHGGVISPGLTFVLEGADVAQHAGERVEVKGKIGSGAGKLPLMPQAEQNGAPGYLPSVIQVSSIKTLEPVCSR